MVNVISFTYNGHCLNRKLCSVFDTFRKFEFDGSFKTGDFAKKSFEEGSPMVFIGAAGIAVRAAAPFIKDKMHDPAVIVIDEKGRYVIPLLSGHVGGGNKLAVTIADALGAVPVLTTATDVNGLFAVDVFAAENGLVIKERELAKKISSLILKGEKIPFVTRLEVSGGIPKEINLYSPGNDNGTGFVISPFKENPFLNTLHLIPKNAAVGIGCRRGASVYDIEKAVFSALERSNIDFLAVKNIATIDIKKDENGLLEFCGKYDIKPVFYSAEELKNAEGVFSHSDFVQEKTGVGNVCERSAVLCEGNIVAGKSVLNGVTTAISMKGGSVCFE
ncbi:cobalamin biosynthesis protein [Anaerotignum faecicola]|nr:cobalamin biosynthesis protein [Anaerotignum faecicola]